MRHCEVFSSSSKRETHAAAWPRVSRTTCSPRETPCSAYIFTLSDKTRRRFINWFSKPLIRSCLHKAGKVWKRSFISTVTPFVHTNTSPKRTFSKTLFKSEEFENAGYSFPCGQKTYQTELFENANGVTISCDFPNRVFLKRKSKMTGDCCVFEFLLRSVDGRSGWSLRFKIAPA